jgi:hypothetical protein
MDMKLREAIRKARKHGGVMIEALSGWTTLECLETIPDETEPAHQAGWSFVLWDGGAEIVHETKQRPFMGSQYRVRLSRSARHAAIAAGLLRLPNGLDMLKRAWRLATDQEREAFLARIRWQLNPKV